MCVDGTWGYISGSGWSVDDAYVSCVTLGYDGIIGQYVIITLHIFSIFNCRPYSLYFNEVWIGYSSFCMEQCVLSTLEQRYTSLQ